MAGNAALQSGDFHGGEPNPFDSGSFSVGVGEAGLSATKKSRKHKVGEKGVQGKYGKLMDEGISKQKTVVENPEATGNH